MRSDFSNTVTECPARLSWSAAARPAGPEPTIADLLPRPRRRRTRSDPALVPRPVDDRDLDGLDRDRILVDAQHAGSLARRGTQLAGELREVIGRVQTLDRRLPAIAIDQVVPVRNQIPQRTALMTERNAAVHAAAALHLQFAGGVRQVHLLPVLDSLGGRTRGVLLAMDLDEPGRLTHGLASPHPPRRPWPQFQSG